MALRTNYKDDVFTGKRKYRMITNPDTTVSFDDETDYTQQGDTYGAAQINALNALANDLDAHAYRDSDTAETNLADNDSIPFYDASAGAKRNVLFSNLKNFLLGAFAPKSHPSNSASTYGAGNGSQFGHVKLSDNYTSSAGTASQSVGASSQAVYNAYANRAPVNHASSETTYGKGTSSAYGHLKVSDTYTSNPGNASAGVAASGKAAYDIYQAVLGKAQKNHASALTDYGKGTETTFGHLKISDSTQGSGSAEDGVAASSRALERGLSYAAMGRNAILARLHAPSNDDFYFDYQNGKYGFNTSANRGADTFHPFSSAPEYVAYVFNNSSYWAGGNISVTEVASGTMIARGHKAGNVDGDYDVNVFGSASLGDFTINWVDTDNVRQVIANTAGTYIIVTRSFKALQASSVSIQDVAANAMLYNKADSTTYQDEMVTIWKLY